MASLAHRWQFVARFRRGSFGWKSQPAVHRVKEAVREIRQVARTDPALGAEGAVSFLCRLAAAIEQVEARRGRWGTRSTTPSTRS